MIRLLGKALYVHSGGEERTDEKAVDGGLLCLGDRGVARDEVGVVVGPFSGLPALQSSTSCHTCTQHARSRRHTVHRSLASPL